VALHDETSLKRFLAATNLQHEGTFSRLYKATRPKPVDDRRPGFEVVGSLFLPDPPDLPETTTSRDDEDYVAPEAVKEWTGFLKEVRDFNFADVFRG